MTRLHALTEATSHADDDAFYLEDDPATETRLAINASVGPGTTTATFVWRAAVY